MTKIVAIIPAHLDSVRFPRKILFPIENLVMIEHVRRRALMAEYIDDVYVATCDQEIADAVQAGGGKVIMTANTHRNGTSRIAEAVTKIDDCTHVILLQGDEPLLLPRHVDGMAKRMQEEPEVQAWNATAPINEEAELDRHSFVKCSTTPDNRILYCFRRSPSFAPFDEQVKYIRKILGIIGFRKDFLLHVAAEQASRIETFEFIEQMRIVENGHALKSVPVDESLPSVNEPQEVDLIFDYLSRNEEQQNLFAKVLGKSIPS